jgi:hypothetical protein
VKNRMLTHSGSVAESLRECSRIDARDYPQRILVVQLLENFIRQI